MTSFKSPRPKSIEEEILYYLKDDPNQEKLVNTVKKLPGITDIFSEQQIYEEASEMMSVIFMRTSLYKKDPLDVIKEYIVYLTKEKEYSVIILFDELVGIPIGTKIDFLEIIKEDRSDKYLDKHLTSLEKHRKFIFKDCIWAKGKFKSYRIRGVGEELYEKLRLPCSILSLLMHWNLDVKRTVGVIYHPNDVIQYLSPQEHLGGWSKFPKKIFGKYLDILSKITQKESPTKLEKKILQSLQLFGLSRITKQKEIRFFLLISAFESLLLTENDRDYLGKKLAEKTSFLLSKKYDKRLEIYRLMKKYYKKRSRLVHGGQSKIEKVDEMTIDNIYENLLYKLLELTKKYDKMEQKDPNKTSDKEGIEDLINKYKFS